MEPVVAYWLSARLRDEERNVVALGPGEGGQEVLDADNACQLELKRQATEASVQICQHDYNRRKERIASTGCVQACNHTRRAREPPTAVQMAVAALQDVIDKLINDGLVVSLRDQPQVICQGNGRLDGQELGPGWAVGFLMQ